MAFVKLCWLRRSITQYSKFRDSPVLNWMLRGIHNSVRLRAGGGWKWNASNGLSAIIYWWFYFDLIWGQEFGWFHLKPADLKESYIPNQMKMKSSIAKVKAQFLGTGCFSQPFMIPSAEVQVIILGWVLRMISSEISGSSWGTMGASRSHPHKNQSPTSAGGVVSLGTSADFRWNLQMLISQFHVPKICWSFNLFVILLNFKSQIEWLILELVFACFNDIWI